MTVWLIFDVTLCTCNVYISVFTLEMSSGKPVSRFTGFKQTTGFQNVLPVTAFL